jgi:hypothetical protein
MQSLNADANRPGTIFTKMKAQLASSCAPVYHETSYPFIPAIRDQYGNDTSGTPSSLTSLANLISELEIHRGTWTKENPFLSACDNVNAVVNELPKERSLATPDNEENVIRNSCRFQRTRTGNPSKFWLEFRSVEKFHYISYQCFL